MRCCTAQMVNGSEIRPPHLFPVVQIDPLPGLMAQEGISGNKASQTSAPLQHAWQLLVFVAVIYHSNKSPTLATNPPTKPVYWCTYQPVFDRCASNSLKVIEFVMAVPRRQIKAVCMHTAAESHSGNQADEACDPERRTFIEEVDIGHKTTARSANTSGRESRLPWLVLEPRHELEQLVRTQL